MRIESKFINNLENLSYVGFKVVDVKTNENKDAKSIYSGYESKLNRVQKQLDKFQRNIDIKERKIDTYENRIDSNKRILENMKSQKGFFVRFSSQYKITKKRIKRFEQLKDKTSKEIKEEYKNIKKSNKKYKEINKELNRFKKYVNKFAKEHKDEIKFITYYKKNKNKLEAVYSENQINKINKYIKRLIAGEKGYENMTVKECLSQMKEAIKSRYGLYGRVKKQIDNTKQVVFGPKDSEESKKETEVIKEVDREKEIEKDALIKARNRKFRENLRNNAIFERSSINREAFSNTLRNHGILFSPEEVALALGFISMRDDYNIDKTFDAIKDGSIHKELTEKSSVYAKKGLNMLEDMINGKYEKDTEFLSTEAGRISKQLVKLYNKTYENQKQKDEKQPQKATGERS